MAYSRPDLPYLGPPRKNNKRYENLTKDRRAPTAEMFDAEMNYVVDSLNTLEASVEKVQAGRLTDSDNDVNKDKVLKTDGKGNISWIKIGSDEITDKGVTKKNMAPDSVSEDTIENEAVTSGKIRKKSLTKEHFDTEVVTRDAIERGAVTDEKITGPLNGAKIQDRSLHLSKLYHESKQPSFVVGTQKDKLYGTLEVTDTYKIPTLPEGKKELEMRGLEDFWAKAKDESFYVGKLYGTLDSQRIPTLLPAKIYEKESANKSGVVTFKSGEASFLEGPTNLERRSFLRTEVKSPGGMPSFGELERKDLPKGSYPIYMASWKNGKPIKVYDPDNIARALAPATENSLYMKLTFKQLNVAYVFITVTDYGFVQTGLPKVVMGNVYAETVGAQLSSQEVAFLSTHGGSIMVYGT